MNEIAKWFDSYNLYKLSIIGKVTVIKTLALPKLVYLLTVLPYPGDKLIKELNDMIKTFIWGKTVRIAFNTT